MSTGTGVVYDSQATYPVLVSDVTYLRIDGEEFLARMYRPEGPGPFPALVDVHGGAWSGSDRLSNEAIDQALAASGLVVAAIDFRVAPEHPYPAQVQDANYAVRWLKAHASDFSADASTVGVVGRSSGGHTVPLNAMRPRDARYAAIPLPEAPDVDATVAYVQTMWPVIDSYARYCIAKEKGAEQLVERSFGYFLTEEAMQEGNPQGVLDRGEQDLLPPMQIVHGSADTNVPLYLVEKFAADYRKAGGDLTLDVFPDQPHTFAAEPGPITDQAVEVMRAFIAGQLAGRSVS